MSDSEEKRLDDFNRAVDRWRPVADKLFTEKLRGVSTKEAGAFAVACLEQCAEVFCFLEKPKAAYMHFASRAFDFSAPHVAGMKAMKQAFVDMGPHVPESPIGQA